MDLDQFIQMVKASEQQKCFFHFTDRSNIDSIRQHGLLSTRELEKRGMKPRHGGNPLSLALDKNCGMDQYVHLCFKTGHPMEKGALDGKTIADLVRVKVVPEVIKLPGVLITLDVSNKTGIVGQPPTEALDQMDLKVLYTRMKWEGEVLERLKVVEKCEVIVPTHVPLEYLVF